MKRMMIRLFACALCLMIALLVSLTTPSPSAHAASARSASSALSTNMEREAHSAMPYAVTWYTYCPSPLTAYVKLILANNNFNCFAGSGYLGVPIIQNVYAVQNHNGNQIWFVYYWNGNPGQKKYLQNGDLYVSNGPSGVTQVCLGCQ